MCAACATRNIALLGETYNALRFVYGPHHKAGGESVVWILGQRVIKLTVMRLAAYRRLREVLRMAELPLVWPTELRVVRALAGGRVAVYLSQPRVALYRGKQRGARPRTLIEHDGDLVLFGDGHWKNFDADGNLLDFGKLHVQPDARHVVAL